MGVIIEESGLRFGEYDEDQVFQIEKSGQYAKNLCPNRIKSCEFILQRGKSSISLKQNLRAPNRSWRIFRPMRRKKGNGRMMSL